MWKSESECKYENEIVLVVRSVWVRVQLAQHQQEMLMEDGNFYNDIFFIILIAIRRVVRVIT